MNRTQLIHEMTALGIAPSKKMGQNFLIDDNFLDWIIRAAAPEKDENILEVGPGFGALTERMMNIGSNVTAIEFDRKLAQYLRERLVTRGLSLIEGDACKVDLGAVFGGADFKMISNLPYSAGTIVVANLLDLANPPLSMTIMLQKEVAERFAGSPGTGEYSALTVRIQALYDVKILRNAPPEMFYPAPDVDSAVLRLERKKDIMSTELRKTLSTLARTSFAHRRKKMFKQAASVFGAELVEQAYAHANVDRDIRAERVTVEQFISMARFLNEARGK